MAIFIAFEGREPRVDPTAFLAPTAVLIGDVVVKGGATIWFGAVLRADFDRIEVGEGTSIQDNVVLHTAHDLPTIIGSNVTIGHLSVLEGCVVENDAVVGMGSIVLHRARIGHGAMVAAGSVVKEGTYIPPGVMAAGVPATVKKHLSGLAAKWVKFSAKEYHMLRLRYLQKASVINRHDDFR